MRVFSEGMGVDSDFGPSQLPQLKPKTKPKRAECRDLCIASLGSGLGNGCRSLAAECDGFHVAERCF